MHQVRRGDLVWINCHHPHEHGAVQDDPWEVYWIRAEGPRLAKLSDLLGVRDTLQAVVPAYSPRRSILAGVDPCPSG
jgi:hypothetical protein